jgi:hypothetical protein
LQEYHAKLSLYIQDALLRANEKVAIGIAECSTFHTRINQINIQCDSFLKVRIAASGKSMEPINKIDALVVRGQWERAPFGLLRERLYAMVGTQETIFDVCFRGNSKIAIFSRVSGM